MRGRPVDIDRPATPSVVGSLQVVLVRITDGVVQLISAEAA
jgi:hypothetical protein